MHALPQETKDALDGGLGIDLSLPVWLRQQPEAVQRRHLGSHTLSALDARKAIIDGYGE